MNEVEPAMEADNEQSLSDFLSPQAFKAPQGLSFDQWVSIGELLADMEQGIAWWYGDWWLHGEGHYGEEHSQGAPDSWPALKTLQNRASICSRFTVSRRRETLSFSHHAAVAYVEPGLADELLDQAEDEGLSEKELRTRKRLALGGADSDDAVTPQPEPAPEVLTFTERQDILNAVGTLRDYRPSTIIDVLRETWDDELGQRRAARFRQDLYEMAELLLAPLPSQVRYDEAMAELDDLLEKDNPDPERAAEILIESMSDD